MRRDGARLQRFQGQLLRRRRKDVRLIPRLQQRQVLRGSAPGRRQDPRRRLGVHVGRERQGPGTGQGRPVERHTGHGIRFQRQGDPQRRRRWRAHHRHRRPGRRQDPRGRQDGRVGDQRLLRRPLHDVRNARHELQQRRHPRVRPGVLGRRQAGGHGPAVGRQDRRRRLLRRRLGGGPPDCRRGHGHHVRRR